MEIADNFLPYISPVNSTFDYENDNFGLGARAGRRVVGRFVPPHPRPLPSGEGSGVGWNADGVFRCENGKISFKSDAPLEVISAKSSKLRGVIDTAKQTFAWSVEIKTFEGFNSPLQREHFNENYMESKKYPKASFSGKIIEKIDFQKNGIYAVRAKGQLNIHGVEQERIIKSQLEVNGGKLRVQASFTVPLADHNITIPKVVYQKIAEEIAITVNAELTGN